MHPIENILQITMSQLNSITDVDTIVGEPFITSSGATIIPISKLSFGFVSGGAEYETKTDKQALPFGAGSASGVSITPVAFLVSEKQNLRLMPAESKTTIDKIIDTVPQLLNEIICACKTDKENENKD